MILLGEVTKCAWALVMLLLNQPDTSRPIDSEASVELMQMDT